MSTVGGRRTPWESVHREQMFSGKRSEHTGMTGVRRLGGRRTPWE